MKIGVVHGRFQPLHKGHVDDYILLAKDRCDQLIVGITNPDPTHTLPDSTNYARTNPRNNPLTYFERLTIIQVSLAEAGIQPSDLLVVPFPINFPQLLRFYLPPQCTHYLTIFDDWGTKKEKFLRSEGLDVKVIFKKDSSEKMISSTEVRDRILKDRNWRDLVPRAAHSYIEQYNLKERLKNLRDGSL